MNEKRTQLWYAVRDHVRSGLLWCRAHGCRGFCDNVTFALPGRYRGGGCAWLIGVDLVDA